MFIGRSSEVLACWTFKAIIFLALILIKKKQNCANTPPQKKKEKKEKGYKVQQLQQVETWFQTIMDM